MKLLFITKSRFSLTIIVLFLVLCFFAIPLNAQRTDVVVMNNGDKVTGEIKKLDRGILEYMTDDMGMLRIEWDKIHFIESQDIFDVETRWGQHFIGSLQKSDEAQQLKVALVDARATLSLIDVVRITPLEDTFFKSLKGYIDAGVSYQNADKFFEFTLGIEVNHHTVKWSNKLKGTSYLRTQRGGSDTRRANLEYTLIRTFKNRWNSGFFGSLEQNDELDLVLRGLAGFGGGRYFIQTNNLLFHSFVGLTTSQEKKVGDEDYHTNVEALLSTAFEAFRHVSPKLDFTTSFQLFPSITEWGRMRLNFDARLRYELLSDFYIGVTVFDLFDADLRAGGERRNDFGIDTTLSWSFK